MWLVLGILGVLFFGKRLPEVGKSVAGAIVNFKKGLKEAQEEIERSNDAPRPALTSTQPASDLPSDAKFDPYTGQPIDKPKFDPYTGKPIVEDTHDTHDAHSDTHENVA
jgi:sec-independent protein translocase protein TatA